MTGDMEGRMVGAHTRRVGAYLFFALCAFCVSVIAGIIVKKIGGSDIVQDAATYVSMVVVFMTLRDMTTTRALAGERP